MRLLFFHADSFRFETDERAASDDGATGDGAAVTGNRGPPPDGERAECLVAFLTIEATDEADLDAVIANAGDELSGVADQLRTEHVVLYPSAGLSDDPADVETAAETLRALAARLDDYDVCRVPVTGDTAFELAAKGHPFAEQSRRVTAHPPTHGAERPEWVVAFPDGSTKPVGEFGDTQRADSAVTGMLSTLLGTVRTDAGGDHGEEALERAGTEAGLLAATGSGTSGSWQLTSRGTFVRDAIVEHVREQAVSAGAVPVETAAGAPVTDSASPAGAASSTGSDDDPDPGSGRRVVPSAPGRPAIRPAVLTLLTEQEQTRPQSVYQRSVDQGSAGQQYRRGRTFASTTTPELWTLVDDLTAAREVLVEQAALTRRIGAGLALDTVPLLRVTAAFADEHGEWLGSLVEALDEPVVRERRQGPQTWAVALTFLTVLDGAPVETGSIRLDRESTRRLGAVEAGTDAGLVLSCVPVGSAERAVLTVAARASQRDSPRLPTWLSSTQVRFVPTDPAEYREACEAFAATLATATVRADVDDRERTVGERLNRADEDWVPYEAVVGREEAESGTLRVFDRAAGAEVELTVDALRERVLADVDGYPRKARYLPRHLSERPTLDRQDG